MADRVHPSEDTPPSSAAEAPAKTAGEISTAIVETSDPQPGTYVIQIPKDQIYRYPPPENALRYQKAAARGKRRRRCCCRCLSWTLGVLGILVVLLGVAAGVLYLVYRPKALNYSVDSIAIRGFNLLSSTSAISPEFDVTVRAENPNKKIGIYYEGGSSGVVYYSDVDLCDGVLPQFYQPSNNLTVFQTALRGSNILFTSADRSALVAEQKQGIVPLRLNLKAPVKIKVGAVKTWTITFKVKCDVAVDSLTTSSKIVSNHCKYSVKPW